MFERIWDYLTTSWRAHEALEKWKNWRWSNTALMILSIVFFAIFVQTQLAHQIFEHFKGYSYIGVFLAGILSPSTFTVVPAYALIFGFANELNPLFVALVAGAGAMTGDYILYRFIKNKVFEELEPLIAYFRNERVIAIFHTPYFAWLLPLVGVFMIASPLPDELGISLLGASNVRRRVFLMLTFAINSIGILLVILAARLT